MNARTDWLVRGALLLLVLLLFREFLAGVVEMVYRPRLVLAGLLVSLLASIGVIASLARR